MSCLQKITEMYAMLGQGQYAEAFEKYYHNDVVVTEATGDVREGKEAGRKAGKEFWEMVKEVHGGGTNGITSNEESKITMVETWVELTFQHGNRIKMEQVAVQHWEGDLIVKEKFYYNPNGMGGGAEQ